MLGRNLVEIDIFELNFESKVYSLIVKKKKERKIIAEEIVLINHSLFSVF